MDSKEYRKIKQHFKQTMRAMFKTEGLNCITIDVGRGYKPYILFSFAKEIEESYTEKYGKFISILRCHSDYIRERKYGRNSYQIVIQFDTDAELYWLFNAVNDFHTKDSEGFELWSRLQ